MNNSASDWCWPSLGGTLQVGGGGYLDTSRVWIRLPQVWQLQEQWNSFIFALNINCHFMKKAKCLVKLEAYATAVGCFGAHWPLSMWWVTTHNPGLWGSVTSGLQQFTFPRLLQVPLFKAAQIAGLAAGWAHVESPGLDLNPSPWIHLIKNSKQAKLGGTNGPHCKL